MGQTDLDMAVMKIVLHGPMAAGTFDTPAVRTEKLRQLDLALKWARSLPNKQERLSYLKWLDYAKREIQRYIDQDEQNARAKALMREITQLPAFPSPPTETLE